MSWIDLPPSFTMRDALDAVLLPGMSIDDIREGMSGVCMGAPDGGDEPVTVTALVYSENEEMSKIITRLENTGIECTWVYAHDNICNLEPVEIDLWWPGRNKIPGVRHWFGLTPRLRLGSHFRSGVVDE